MRRLTSQLLSGLRFRLLLLVVLACAPLAGLTLHNASNERRQQVADWQQRSQETVQQAKREEQKVVGQTRQLLLALAESSAVRSGNRRECKKLLDDLFASYPRYANLGLVRTNGDFLASALPPAGLPNQANQDFFRRALATRAFAIGHFPSARTTGKATVSFGYPVLDSASNVLAVVFAALDLDWFHRYESEFQAQLPKEATWSEIDRKGTILVRHPEPEKWTGQPLPESSLAKTIFSAPEGVVEALSPEGKPGFYAYVSMRSLFVSGDVVALLAIPKQVLFADVDRALQRNLAGLGIAASLALLLGWIGSYFLILRPVTALVNSSSRLAAGDLSARTGLSHGADELGQLTRAFDRMAQALEQREKERRLAELDRARLAAIVECSEDAIVGKTADGIVVTWNHGAERLYGYTAEEMIGRPISRLFTPEHEQQCLQIMEKVRRRERVPVYNTKRRRKDGTVISVAVDLCPIEVREGESVETSQTAAEISRMKQMEEQFRQSQKMEAVSRLAGGMAHNFNNVLTVISGYSEVLLEALSPNDPTRASLEEIKKAGERAAALTRQLLVLSRKQVLDPRVLELNAAVANCEKMLKQLIGDGIVLVTVLDPDLLRVRVDPIQLEQVLTNLAVHARDAMPQGGKLTIETANAVLDQAFCRAHAQVKPGRYIRLSVSDTGRGMDEQAKAHVFEPFFADLASREPEKVTGLSLAIIDGFIKQSGGHIYVQSEPGQGSTFKIYLPAIETSPSEAN
jgi:PAS domain S-box-containing protein